MSRRQFLRTSTIIAGSLGSTAGLLAACGGDDDDDDEAPAGEQSQATATDAGKEETAAPEEPTEAPSTAEVGQEERPPDEATGDLAIFNFGALQEPTTLDPHLSTSVFDVMLLNVYGLLVDVDAATGEVVPELATKWEISDDGLTVTFELREGVTFHDGTPFNAEAAKFNFERAISLQSYVAEAFEAIDSIEVVDEFTLQVTLKQVVAPWIAMLTRNPKMISPTAVTEHEEGGDQAQAWLAENTAGSEAYMHTRWDRGSNLVWEAFPDYWRGWEGRHVTTVNNRIVLEAGTQRIEVEGGALDMALNVPQDSLPALRENPDLNVLAEDQPNHLYLRFNNFVGPTADVRVRKAMSYAFDYSVYQELLGFEAPRAEMPIPLELFSSDYEPVEIPYFMFDPDMAKQLLEEAGYGDGISINLFHEGSTPQKGILAEYFQAAMSDVGITVEIVVEPFVNILARGADQEAQKNFDSAVHSWVLFTPPVYPEASSFLLRMYTPYPQAVRNILGYNNPEVARLTNEGVQQTDPAKAQELYWQANLLIVEDAPDLILDRSVQFPVLRKGVHGHISHKLEPWRWTYWDVWKEDG